MTLKLLATLLLFAPYTYGANILAISPTPSYSHQIAYTYIWKELSLRGHKVTVLTTDPLKDPKLTNLTEINLKWIYKYADQIRYKLQNELTMWNLHDWLDDLQWNVANGLLSYKEVQNLIHKKNNFDVVLTEFLYPEMLAFAEIYKCPKILFTTLDATAYLHQSVGNSISPALYPDIGANFYGDLNFRERLISTVYTWYLLYFYSYNLYVKRNQLVKKYFNISRTIHEMDSNIDMLFLNVNPLIQPIRAVGPSTIIIGDERSVLDLSPLPPDILKFLDSATNGFIYFSLGGNLKIKNLPKQTLDNIINALSEVPYRILWKFEGDELPNKPENVKLIKWAPQQRVLSHPNIKLFITQGGLQSMEEGIYREVPFVVIPFYGDQFQNANIMVSKGIAVIVNRLPSISQVELKNAILEVISNPKYKNAVGRLKQLATDFPMSGLEKAIWWIEYVIRNKGAKHLRNPAADISFYQYYLLDVISFLIFVSVALVVLSYIAIRKIYRFVQSYISSKPLVVKRKYK